MPADTSLNVTVGGNRIKFKTFPYTLNGLNLKSNTASPTFTGTPAAPTATTGTNTTQIATTAFVQSQITTSANSFANYTASGDGASTAITITHGLSGISGTSKVIVQPLNAD